MATELSEQGLAMPEVAELAPFKVMEGNRPSSTLLCERLTPFNLGTFLAMYEHKTAILGMLWNINSFDQWGVELGKKLAIPIAKELSSGMASHQHDASTNGLIAQASEWGKNNAKRLVHRLNRVRFCSVPVSSAKKASSRFRFNLRVKATAGTRMRSRNFLPRKNTESTEK